MRHAPSTGFLLGLILGIIFCVGPTRVLAETAAESFARGETLLAKGDFAGAMESYAAAARADLDRREYVQRYAMTRRVVELRSRLAAEQDRNRWEQIARALRAFYLQERIYPELLKLDQQAHARLGSADSAAALAETQLTVSENAAAEITLSAFQADKATPMTQSLLGIAMARNGRKDQAKPIAEKLQLPDDAEPGLLYAAARLHASAGNSDKAISLLQKCFETTLPSQLDGFKTHVKACPEFVAMVSTPTFAQVMNVESKKSESKCSGGSGCAGCPMSGKCPKSQAKQ